MLTGKGETGKHATCDFQAEMEARLEESFIL